MAATVNGDVLVLDNGTLIHLGRAWKVSPHDTNPNFVIVNNKVYDLGTPYAGLLSAIRTALSA